MPKNKKIILIVLIILVFLGINFLYFYSIAKSPPPNPIGISYGVATLEINGQRYENKITTEISVYDFMDKLRNEGEIDFTEKNYTGMGKFIETINGVRGNGSENWIYYVNNKKANIGVSNYKINKGDIVSWKYEKNY